MGKEKRSKHRYSRSEESSRRSRSSSNRSSSSESYKHRSKKHKHKEEKKRKHESKKDKKNKKEEKREDRKYRERETERERPVKIEQEHIEDMNQRYPNNLKEEKIEAEKIEYEEQQQLSNREREMLIINDNPEEEQQLQEDNKPKKEEPNFEPSGILLEYYNSREGVSLRFHEPPEAREPQEQWRMYIFKGEEVLSNILSIDLDPIELTKSSYLIGKDDRVVDILAENPSISRQHCVVQFRLIQRRQTEGDYLETVKPYIMDLESTNGTFLNDEKIESGRYYELLHRDVLKFGFSDREYVIVRWEENQQEENGDGDGGN